MRARVLQQLSVGSVLVLTLACDRPPEPSPKPETVTAPQKAPPAPPPVPKILERADPPAQGVALAPALTATAPVRAVWLQRGEDGTTSLHLSTLKGEAWSTPETIAQGEDIFGNWADTPSVTESLDGSLLVHWAQKSGDAPYAYDVQLTRKPPGGAWTPMGAVHSDGTETEHGFVSALPTPTGVRLFWLDGRNTAEPTKGPMTLRTAMVGDSVTDERELDARVCDCCNTGAAMTPQGPVVFYRDRTADELRDVAMVRRVKGEWTAPAPLAADGWKTAGCPVNGPRAAAHDDTLAVAWYTAPEGAGKVRLALSRDAGRTFGPAIDLDAGQGDQAPLGRVGIARLPGGEFLVSWLAGAADHAVIRMARVARDGRVGPGYDLASVDRGRASGFPRVAIDGDQAVVVWTHVVEPGNREAKKRAVTALRGMRMSWAIVPAPGSPASDRGPAASQQVPRARVGETLDLSATTLDGAKVGLGSLRGRPVLLNLWASWCRPCREELPVLERLRVANPNLAVVALTVDTDGDLPEVRRMVADAGLGATIWHDGSGQAGRILGASSLPLTVLLDPAGRIVWRSAQPLKDDDPALGQALAKLGANEK